MRPPSVKTCPSCGERYDTELLFCPRDGAPLARGGATPTEDAYLGLELAGQLRLTHLLGMGAMGRVYRAWQAGIERSVAVKILHPELARDPELVRRFHREAKITSRLVHPNVVQVLMTGELPRRRGPDAGGELYLVMEHLDGVSLRSLLAASGEDQALPLGRALRIALQICDAVGEAHAQSIVHRDLKPENVMLVRRGDDPDVVKVLDFGVARLDWADQSMATQAGLIFGTAKYISPEGAEGRAVDAAADVYSIATILYQCLAGRTPFEGDSHVALLVQHAHAPPPPLRSLARSSYVPAPIEVVIMQNLAKRPEERAPDARAFGRELILAARASGLDPDAILTGSSLRLNAGPMRLASRERTKGMELIAPQPTGEPAAEALEPVEGRGSLARLDQPSSDGSASAEDGVDEDETAGPADEEAHGDAAPPSRADGARSTPRARVARVAAGLVLATVAAFAAVAGGRRVGMLAADQPDETVESYLDKGRESLRKHAWDAPSPSNIRALTDRALARFPGEPRILELRREAAERMVSDALGRSYAGDRESARRIARLALELHPRLTSAQHLLADLETAMVIATAAPTPPPAPSKQTATAQARSGPAPTPPLATSASANQEPPRPGPVAQPASAAGPAPSAEPPAKPRPALTPVSAPDPSSTPWL